MIEIEAKYLSFYCLFLIGNFDLLLDAMLMTEIRSKYLDFMYPVITDSYIVVIKNDLDKVHDYTLFYGILNHEVWLVLIILCLLPSIIIAIQELFMETQKFSSRKFMFRLFESKMYYSNIDLWNFFYQILLGFASNFGGSFFSRGGIQKHNQLTIFSYYISGMIVWICFRATIVARLSHKNPKLPFIDLNDIPNTDYLVTTSPIDWALGDLLAKALPGTIYNQIFKNNMDIEKSFIGEVQGMKELMEHPLRAHFHSKQVD